MDVSTTQTFLYALVFLFISLFISICRRKNQSENSQATGLKTYPLIGILPDFIKNRHRFLDWVTEILAASPNRTMVFHNPCQPTMLLTANPSLVEYFLKTNFDNYPKGRRSHDMVEDFLGDGIFNSDGKHWKDQRKTASFEFNSRSLRNFVVNAVHTEISERLLPLLRRAGDDYDGVVDLQDVLQRFAFDNICKVAFDIDPAALAGEEADRRVPPNFMKDFDDAAKLISDRFLDALSITWRVKRFLNIGSERRLRESIKVVHEFALEIIRARKERLGSLQSDDLLSRFMTSAGDRTDEFLRDIVVSFLIAGRETTSSALTWFFWLVSSRPEVENKILEEVARIRARNPESGEAFSFDELRQMDYLHAAITESMRLYPPVPIDTVSCLNDDVMPDGTFVGGGWVVSYLAYSMGRMESIWGEDCSEYKPERWLTDGVFRPESPFRFPAFHAGPRMCLGKEMAYTQMKSIAASVLERFEIELVEKEKLPQQVLSVTLRMKELPVKVRKRMQG